MEDLRGRPALVTGASRGIGRAIATELARHGADVTNLDAARPGADAAAAVSPAAVRHVAGDVREPAGALLDRVLAATGGRLPELLVNNAGVDLPGRFLDAAPETLDDTLATNLVGPWGLTRALVERWLAGEARSRPAPSIVFVASLHSRFPRGRPHYGASKAAVVMLVRELARELGPRGIRVNAVSPGWIPTRGSPPAEEAAAIPLGRFGHPEDVAPVVAALLSERVSGYVTGADVPVDGGLATHTWTS